MAHVGQVVDNPVTKDTLTIVAMGDDRFEMDFTMYPGGFIPTLHTHPNQQERFRIVAGRPLFSVARRKHRASPGETIVVPPRTAHKFRNDTGEDVRINVEFTPALRTAELFVVLGTLAQTGKLTKRGIPRNPLLGAMFVHEFRNEIRSAGMLAITNAFVAPMAALGRLFGLRLPA
ncbi:MAG TPA: cupin domain-containing protein [Actinomycetota bacterium]|jgi:mannose-6-phosphate isomerase-like protein (cupin superfamily)|nr:cupin domain-containing protein [Actinomycetota bacterium]